jgi:hypothetical protein
VGLFKGMKDLSNLTKQAKELQRQQQEEAGYKPGFSGQMAQMGDMLSQANEQLAEITDQSGERSQILANGISGQGVIVGHGTPERGAQWFNMDIDMEVHVSGRQPYRVNNMYMVPATATIGQGVTLPIKVDPNDPAKIAIDWDSAQKPPARGEVRPTGGDGFAPAPAQSGGGTDHVAELERLLLRDSGALTDAEFERQKAKILAASLGACAGRASSFWWRECPPGAGARDAGRRCGGGRAPTPTRSRSAKSIRTSSSARSSSGRDDPDRRCGCSPEEGDPTGLPVAYRRHDEDIPAARPRGPPRGASLGSSPLTG